MSLSTLDKEYWDFRWEHICIYRKKHGAIDTGKTFQDKIKIKILDVKIDVKECKSIDIGIVA